MATTRTKSVITIFSLLIVLAVLSAASLAISQLGFLVGGRGRPQFAVNGTPGPNGNFQPRNGNGNGGGNGGFQGGNGGGGGFQGGNGGNFQGGGGGGFQGRGGGGAFAIFGAARSLGVNPQIFGFINIGIAVLGIVLVSLCAVGIWKQKKSALNWALVLGILFLLGALPGLFGLFMGGGRFGFNIISPILSILSLVASVGIVGMTVLPSVRDNFS